MSKRLTDNWLAAYLEYTDNTEPPYLYRLWTGISTIAAALQRKCWLKWDRILYPNFYIVLVGPSGVRKGTAMYPAQDLLRAIDVPLASEAITREALIVELSKTTQSDIDEVTGLPKPYSSLTVFSKEFTVFLGYNNMQLIMDLADWYDCDDRWKYRTKTQGTSEINGVWVNIIGATTPTQLQTTLPLDAIGGGLSSRMIFVYEDKKGKSVTFPDGVHWADNVQMDGQPMLDNSKRERLVDDLMAIKLERGEWIFDKSFRDAWALRHAANERLTKFNGTFLEPYHTRRATHIIKLSMIMNVNRADPTRTITALDLEQANNILVETEKKMPFTFSGMGHSEDSFIIGRVITLIMGSENHTITYKELLSLLINDTTHEQLWRVVEALQRIGRLKMEAAKGNSSDIILTLIDKEK